MKIGILKEPKNDHRVVIVPKDVKTLISQKIEVFIQSNSGKESGFNDLEYLAAGAKVLKSEKLVIKNSDLIFRINKPTSKQIKLCSKSNASFFSEMYLSFDSKTLFKILQSKITSFAFESYIIDGRRPLIQSGDLSTAHFIANISNLLLTKVSPEGIGKSIFPFSSDETPTQITILNDSTATRSMVGLFLAQSANVTILESRDVNVKSIKTDTKLKALQELNHGTLNVKPATSSNIENLISRSDIFIHSPISPDAMANQIITEKMIDCKPKGALYIDLFPSPGFTVSGTYAEQVSSQYFKIKNKKIKFTSIPSLYSQSVSIATSREVRKLIEQIIAFKSLPLAIKNNQEISGAIQTYNGEITSSMIAGNLKLKRNDINKLIK